MATDYDFILSNGNHLIPTSPYTVPSLDSNGPGALSTPRQILDVSFTSGANTVTLNDNALYLRSPLASKNQINIIGSPYAGTYTVASAQPLGNNTVVTIDSTTPLVLESTLFNVTSVTTGLGGIWQVGVGDGPNLFYPGSTFTVTGNTGTGNGTYTVASASVPSAGLTNIVVVETITGGATATGNITPPSPVAYPYASSSTYGGTPYQTTLHIVGNYAGYFTPGVQIVSSGNAHYLYEQLTVVGAVNSSTTTNVTDITISANLSYVIAGVDHTNNLVFVEGDRTIQFPTGSSFVVTGANDPNANTMFVVGAAGSYVITSVTAGASGVWHIAGNYVGIFVPGHNFLVAGNSDPTADGTYTVVSSTFGTDTAIAVTNIPGAPTATGTIQLLTSASPVYTPSNNITSIPISSASLSAIPTWMSGAAAPIVPVFDTTGVVIFPLPAVPYGYVQYATPVDSPLELLGRGSPHYNTDISWGQAIQDNQIHILENFANSLPPPAPLSGMLWYDTSAPALSMFGSALYPIVSATSGVGGTLVIAGDSTLITTPGSTVYVYGNAGLNTGTKYVVPFVVSTAVYTAPNTTITVSSPGDTTGVTKGSLGSLFSKNDFHSMLVAGFPAVASFDLGGHGIINLKTTAISSLNNLTEPALGSPVVSQWYADNYLAGLPINASVPNVDDAIKWNGTRWVNGTFPINAGPGVNYFFTNTGDSISTPYHQISKTPDNIPEIDENTTVSSVTSPVLIDGNVSTTILGGTQIDPGVWAFTAYAYTDTAGAGATSTIRFDVFSFASPYTPGVGETLLFSATTPPITNVGLANIAIYTVESAQPAFAINTTDKLLIKVYALTTSVTNAIVSFAHSGTAHYSYVNTPLLLRHNDLPGLQGGAVEEYYHLTSAEYAGTGTGVFVRATGPAITSGSINNTTVGAITPTTGAFTTLSANQTVTLSPSNFNVTISPTGTGTVTVSPVGALTINPTALGTIDNTSIGGTTASTGRFTTVTSTVATGTPPLTVSSTTMVANLNVANAGVAATLTTTASSANALFYPTFTSPVAGDLTYNTNAGFTFNPSTGTLTATTFYGALSGNAATTNGLTTTSSPVVVSGAAAPSAGQVLTATSSTTATWQQPPSAAQRTINAQTGTTYTFVLSDAATSGANTFVTFNNASPVAVTVPPNSSVLFPIGTELDCASFGVGKVTFVPAAGVTINSMGSMLSINGQYVGVSLIQTALNTWILIGSLAA